MSRFPWQAMPRAETVVASLLLVDFALLAAPPAEAGWVAAAQLLRTDAAEG